MKNSKSLMLATIASFAIASVWVAGTSQVYAADFKFDVVSCYSGPAHLIQHADGMIAGSYDGTGMLRGVEGTPMHMLSGRCVGAFTLINSDYNENGSCEFWNATGDKIFGVYARKGDPAKAEGTWHVVNGTGKFAGMTEDSKWIPVTNFPPVPNAISTCNHEWGTYSNEVSPSRLAERPPQLAASLLFCTAISPTCRGHAYRVWSFAAVHESVVGPFCRADLAPPCPLLGI